MNEASTYPSFVQVATVAFVDQAVQKRRVPGFLSRPDVIRVLVWRRLKDHGYSIGWEGPDLVVKGAV